jgi:hypothetical protein
MNNALYKNLGRFDLESNPPTRTLKSLLLFAVCYLFFFVRCVRQHNKHSSNVYEVASPNHDAHGELIDACTR